jgi:hypothetical protein
MRSGLSTHAFADVSWNRLRRVAQLAAVDQLKPSVAEELVDFVRDRACDLENAKLGHAEKLDVVAAKSVPKSLPSDQFHAFSRRSSRLMSRHFSRRISRLFFTPYFTSFVTTHFT